MPHIVRIRESGSQPAHVKRAGRTVSQNDHEARKLVAERREKFKGEYKTLGYSRDSYENFAQWATNEFDDMPSDDPAELERMVRALRRSPQPSRLV